MPHQRPGGRKARISCRRLSEVSDSRMASRSPKCRQTTPSDCLVTQNLAWLLEWRGTILWCHGSGLSDCVSDPIDPRPRRHPSSRRPDYGAVQHWRRTMSRCLVRIPAGARHVTAGDRARRGAVMIPPGTLPSHGLCLEAATLPVLGGSALIGWGACARGAVR